MKSDYRVLAFCLAVLCCLMGIFYLVDSTVEIDDTSVKSGYHRDKVLPIDSGNPTNKIHLVRFDPNTADSTTLLGLGLPRWMVRGIYKYRAKGGVYSTPEDFARVPGLTWKKYKELRPYITISDDYKEARLFVHSHRNYYQDTPIESSKSEGKYPKKLTASERIAVNTADTTALKRVPGIGSYYAKRIVDYRTKLGGFISLDQVLEIKNFPESALQYLTIPDGDVRKININKASFKQLAGHPYIGYSRTKTIFDYRRLKGNITSLDQLSLLKGFSKEERDRMEPYIEY